MKKYTAKITINNIIEKCNVELFDTYMFLNLTSNPLKIKYNDILLKTMNANFELIITLKDMEIVISGDNAIDIMDILNDKIVTKKDISPKKKKKNIKNETPIVMNDKTVTKPQKKHSIRFYICLYFLAILVVSILIINFSNDTTKKSNSKKIDSETVDFANSTTAVWCARTVLSKAINVSVGSLECKPAIKVDDHMYVVDCSPVKTKNSVVFSIQVKDLSLATIYSYGSAFYNDFCY